MYRDVLVYGIRENDCSQVLDQEWFESKYPCMSMFASNVVQNYQPSAGSTGCGTCGAGTYSTGGAKMDNAVYGYPCTYSSVHGYCLSCMEFDERTPTDAEKEIVQELYTLICKYCEGKGLTKPYMGYFLAVEGDYEKDHTEYVPE